jgi:hypothetical protein
LQYTNAWKHQESLCIAIFISNLQKHCIFLFISYVFSSTKSENKRQNRFCLEVRGVRGKRRGRQGEKMAQTMYAHLNK